MSKDVALFILTPIKNLAVKSTLDWAKAHKDSPGFEATAKVLTYILTTQDDKFNEALNEIKAATKEIKQSQQDIQEQLRQLTNIFLTKTEITTQEASVHAVETAVHSVATSLDNVELARGHYSWSSLGTKLGLMHDLLMHPATGQELGLWDNYLKYAQSNLDARNERYGVACFNRDMNTLMSQYVKLMQQAAALYAWAMCYDRTTGDLETKGLQEIVEGILREANTRITEWNQKLEDYYDKAPAFRFILREIDAQTGPRQPPINLVLVSTDGKVLVPWEQGQLRTQDQRAWYNPHESWTIEYDRESDAWKLKGQYSSRLYSYTEEDGATITFDEQGKVGSNAALFKIVPQPQTEANAFGARLSDYGGGNAFRLGVKVKIFTTSANGPNGQDTWFLDYACGSYPTGLVESVKYGTYIFGSNNRSQVEGMNGKYSDGQAWNKHAFAIVTANAGSSTAFVRRTTPTDRIIYCDYIGSSHFPWRMAVTESDMKNHWNPNFRDYGNSLRPAWQTTVTGNMLFAVYDIPELLSQGPEEARQYLTPDVGPAFSFRDYLLQSLTHMPVGFVLLSLTEMPVGNWDAEPRHVSFVQVKIFQSLNGSPTAEGTFEWDWDPVLQLTNDGVVSDHVTGLKVKFHGDGEGDQGARDRLAYFNISYDKAAR